MDIRFYIENDILHIEANDGAWSGGWQMHCSKNTAQPIEWLEEFIGDYKKMCYDKSKEFKERNNPEEQESEKEFRRSAESED